MAETGTDIAFAASLLRQGELVAIPTETVYGLAANALDEKAVVKIFAAKERPFFDPLIVHLAPKTDMGEYARHIPKTARLLAERFWPGPLTLVLPKKNSIPDLVSSGHDTVGLRKPAQPLCQALLEQLDFPLAAPSANPFGYISPTSAKHVQDQLGDKIAYILDGGDSHVGLESTIVGFERDKPVIYRLGGIAVEEIELTAGAVSHRINNSSNPSAPGQLKSHYAPRIPLVVTAHIEQALEKHAGKKIGLISFTGLGYKVNVSREWQLSPRGNMEEAARNLFSVLREADHSGIDLIIAELLPDKGLGKAINDRLIRASVC